VEHRDFGVLCRRWASSGIYTGANPEEVTMPTPPDPLLNLRAALLLLIALIVGLIAGSLSYLSTRDVPAAVLIGGAAAGGALALFHNLLARH
jgi:hypothetical protein